jgi:hypothetical protein
MNCGETWAFIVHHPSTMKDHPMTAPLNQPADQDPVIIETEVIESSTNENDSKGAVPAWLMSIGAHAAMVAIMAAVVYASAPVEVELPPLRVATVPETQQEKPKENFSIKDPEDHIEIITEQAEKTQPVSVVEVTDVETTFEEEHPEKGNPGETDAVAAVETGSKGLSMSIGAGNLGAGMFSKRKGGGKIRASAISRTGPERTKSTEAALRWFKRHQSPNGMWDVDTYQVNCLDGMPKCEPGVNQAGNADIACTAYAVMCFLGAGYDHHVPNKYRPTVTKAMAWLLAQQSAEGLFGERNYEHAVATMALAEALGMTGDESLKGPAQKAINIILARQAKDPKASDPAYSGLGWDYVEGNAARNDTSVTGWNLMALKSALGAGLQVGSGMAGTKVWLERAWKASNPEWKTLDPYQSESFFPYTYDANSDKAGNNGATGHLFSVGALCAVYLGHHKGDVMLETMANSIMKNNYPTTYPTNTYILYYNTLAIFQIGGERWDKWNKPVATLLSNSQRTDDSCFNGSWDYAGTEFHGSDTGRLLSTAYACLSQEVIWRYEQIGNK